MVKVTTSHTLLDLENFDDLAIVLGKELLRAPEVKTGTWQSTDKVDTMLTTHELLNVQLEIPIGSFQPKLAICTGANMPWAEDHFLERVSGEPLNPPPSEAWWPYAQSHNELHKESQKFSHTYPERFWPKFAGGAYPDIRNRPFNRGIRYEYGDLGDVVDLLKRDPGTRQAYLPVWFPEDTGAVSGQRVPCTLGYQFLLRNELHITYNIRSCDYMRHWRDDIYLAGRLLQWVCEMLGNGAEPGYLVMNIGSLHIFKNDRPILDSQLPALVDKRQKAIATRLMSAL